MRRVILALSLAALAALAACGHPADPKAAVQALAGDVPDAAPDVPVTPDGPSVIVDAGVPVFDGPLTPDAAPPPPFDPCAVPGAIANDGLDDRAAIQAQLDAHGCAHLGPGVYDVETPVVAAPKRRDYWMLLVAGGHLYGDGLDLTTIKFRGDSGGGDWEAVRLTGTSPELDRVTIETRGIYHTDEQTHATRAMFATDAYIHDMRYVHPQRGEPGGDCVQVVGYLTSLVLRTRIANVDFRECDRSGFASHSGAAGLTITDSTFDDTGDQDIDGEGSGEGARDWVIQRCHFKLGHAHQGNYAIQLQLTNNVEVLDDVFDARGIFISSSTNVKIARSELTRTTTGGADAVIEISKASDNVSVLSTVIFRSRLAGVGALVRASPHGTGTPTNVTVKDCALVQAGDDDVINTVGVVGLSVTSNLISYLGAAKHGAGVAANASTTVRTTGIEVVGNTFSGPLRLVAGVSGSQAGTGTFSVRDNRVLGSVAGAAGVFCADVTLAGKVLGPVTTHLNQGMPPAVCGPSGFLQEVL